MNECVRLQRSRSRSGSGLKSWSSLIENVVVHKCPVVLAESHAGVKMKVRAVVIQTAAVATGEIISGYHNVIKHETRNMSDELATFRDGDMQ